MKKSEAELIEAIKNNDLKTFRKALKASANHKEQFDNLGDTPLHYAAWYNRPECLQELIAAGADKGAKNSFGLTPLEYAKERNHKEIIQLLTTHKR